jgi:hypothetical protein
VLHMFAGMYQVFLGDGRMLVIDEPDHLNHFECSISVKHPVLYCCSY